MKLYSTALLAAKRERERERQNSSTGQGQRQSVGVFSSQFAPFFAPRYKKNSPSEGKRATLRKGKFKNKSETLCLLPFLLLLWLSGGSFFCEQQKLSHSISFRFAYHLEGLGRFARLRRKSRQWLTGAPTPPRPAQVPHFLALFSLCCSTLRGMRWGRVFFPWRRTYARMEEEGQGEIKIVIKHLITRLKSCTLTLLQALREREGPARGRRSLGDVRRKESGKHGEVLC